MLDERLTQALMNTPTSRGEFFNKITTGLLAFTKENYGREILFEPDALAMAVAVAPDIVTKVEKRYVQIERTGKFTRGQSVVDWRDRLGRKPNANIVLELNEDRFFELMRQSVS